MNTFRISNRLLTLCLGLALLCLGSRAWLPDHSAAADLSPPTGLTPMDWQAIQSQIAKLTTADGAAEDLFGSSVSVSDNVTFVGAYSADIGSNEGQGATYAFYRHLGGNDAWGQAMKVVASDDAAGDSFGESVAINGLSAIVGVRLADIGDNQNQGAAYVFALPPVAAYDDAYSTLEDIPLDVSAALGVLANDTDLNGAPLFAVLDNAPSHGTLDLHTDGSFVYTPTTGFVGLDTFIYHTNNGETDSNVKTVNITVNPPCIALTGVSIAGPLGVTSTLYIGADYHFQAVITPANATPPITYTWEPSPATGQGTAEVVYRWMTPGLHILILTAENCFVPSTVVDVIREVEVEWRELHFIYLPLVQKK